MMTDIKLIVSTQDVCRIENIIGMKDQSSNSIISIEIEIYVFIFLYLFMIWRLINAFLITLMYIDTSKGISLLG